MQTQIHGPRPERVATKTTRTRPFSASPGIYIRPLRPHLQVPQPHARSQPAPQTNPSSWRPSFLVPLTVLSSVYAKRVQWYRTRPTAHLNQHTRTVCSQHHGQTSQWFRPSKREPATASPHRSHLRWVLKPRDTTLRRHLVPVARKPTTSLPVFASRPSSHGVSLVSTALSPTTPEASRPEKLLHPQASRCGQTMRTRLRRVAPSRRLIRNGARRHRCLATLDFVAIDRRGNDVHRRSKHSLPELTRALADGKDTCGGAQKPTDHLCKDTITSVTSINSKHCHEMGS